MYPLVSGEATSSNAISNETLYILVACLGAFVIFVFLVLIITFILRKNKKPTHRNADSPEARERMLEGASIPSNTQRTQQVVPNLTCPTNLQQVKFVFFEKATTFDEISILLLTNKFMFLFPVSVLNTRLVLSHSTLFTEISQILANFIFFRY